MLAQPPALHLLSKTKSFPQATAQHPHGEGVAENAGSRLGAIKSILQPPIARSPQDTQNPIGPFAPAAQLRFASVIQRSRVGRLTFSSPIRAPSSPAGVASFASRVSFLPPRSPPRPISQPARPFVFLRDPRSSVSPLREAHTSCSAAAWLEPGWPGCFACLTAPRPCHRGGRSSALHPSHQCVIEAIPTLAAINTPVRLGNPLPLAKHVSSLQGLPRGGGECHPLASPDRLHHPRHDIIDPDTRCLFGPPCHQADQPLHSIASAPARGTRPTVTVQLSPSLRDQFRGRIATQRLASFWPLSSSAPSLNYSPPPCGAGCYAGPLACAPPRPWFGSRTCQGIGRNQPSLSPGVSSAVATARVLRFSAMIIGPSRLVA